MADASAPALVTGATGHLGSNLVRVLLARGERVRALVRRPQRRSLLPDDERLEIAEGDLMDVGSLERAVAGCDRIYHAAAVYALWTPEPGSILRTAIAGTQNMFDAIRRSGGVRRVVYTSSAITVGFTPDPERTLDEHDANDGVGQDEYNRAKIDAERLVLRLDEDCPWDTVVVNPSLIVGPGDHGPTPSNRLVVDYINGRVPASYHGGLSVVHVEDVAQGHVLAMLKGKSGERYLLGGENLTMDEILEILESLTGRRRPRVHLPRRLGLLLGSGYELVARVTNRPPLVTRDTMAHLCGNYDRYDSSKARRNLGYAPRSGHEALADAVRWFLERPEMVPSAVRARVGRHFAARG